MMQHAKELQNVIHHTETCLVQLQMSRASAARTFPPGIQRLLACPSIPVTCRCIADHPHTELFIKITTAFIFCMNLQGGGGGGGLWLWQLEGWGWDPLMLRLGRSDSRARSPGGPQASLYDLQLSGFRAGLVTCLLRERDRDRDRRCVTLWSSLRRLPVSLLLHCLPQR